MSVPLSARESRRTLLALLASLIIERVDLDLLPREEGEVVGEAGVFQAQGGLPSAPRQSLPPEPHP